MRSSGSSLHLDRLVFVDVWTVCTVLPSTVLLAEATPTQLSSVSAWETWASRPNTSEATLYHEAARVMGRAATTLRVDKTLPSFLNTPTTGPFSIHKLCAFQIRVNALPPESKALTHQTSPISFVPENILHVSFILHYHPV